MADPITAMIGLGVGGLFSSIGQGVAGGLGADAARDAQRSAANKGLDVFQGQFKDFMNIIMPYVGTGSAALNEMSALLGLPQTVVKQVIPFDYGPTPEEQTAKNYQTAVYAGQGLPKDLMGGGPSTYYEPGASPDESRGKYPVYSSLGDFENKTVNFKGTNVSFNDWWDYVTNSPNTQKGGQYSPGGHLFTPFGPMSYPERHGISGFYTSSEPGTKWKNAIRGAQPTPAQGVRVWKTSGEEMGWGKDPFGYNYAVDVFQGQDGKTWAKIQAPGGKGDVYYALNNEGSQKYVNALQNAGVQFDDKGQQISGAGQVVNGQPIYGQPSAGTAQPAGFGYGGAGMTTDPDVVTPQGGYALEYQTIPGEQRQQEALDRALNQPYFQELIQQGEDALIQGASRTGGVRGGRTQALLSQYRPNMINQQIQQRLANLASLVGVGLSGAQSVGSAGQGMAANVAGLYGQMGGANAQAALGTAAGVGNIFGAAGALPSYGLLGSLYGQNASGYAGSAPNYSQYLPSMDQGFNLSYTPIGQSPLPSGPTSGLAGFDTKLNVGF